jgi:hypothetical protein
MKKKIFLIIFILSMIYLIPFTSRTIFKILLTEKYDPNEFSTQGTVTKIESDVATDNCILNFLGRTFISNGYYMGYEFPIENNEILKYGVSIDNHTRLYEKQKEQKIPISIHDIKVGDKVEMKCKLSAHDVYAIEITVIKDGL